MKYPGQLAEAPGDGAPHEEGEGDYALQTGIWKVPLHCTSTMACRFDQALQSLEDCGWCFDEAAPRQDHPIYDVIEGLLDPDSETRMTAEAAIAILQGEAAEDQ